MDVTLDYSLLISAILGVIDNQIREVVNISTC